MREKPHNSCLRKIRNKKGDLTQSHGLLCSSFHTLHHDGPFDHNRHLTTTESSTVTRGERTKRMNLMWWPSNSIASSLQLCGPVKRFTVQPDTENNGISVHSQCQHELNDALRQCHQFSVCSSGGKNQAKNSWVRLLFLVLFLCVYGTAIKWSHQHIVQMAALHENIMTGISQTERGSPHTRQG